MNPAIISYLLVCLIGPELPQWCTNTFADQAHCERYRRFLDPGHEPLCLPWKPEEADKAQAHNLCTLTAREFVKANVVQALYLRCSP